MKVEDISVAHLRKVLRKGKVEHEINENEKGFIKDGWIRHRNILYDVQVKGSTFSKATEHTIERKYLEHAANNLLVYVVVFGINEEENDSMYWIGYSILSHSHYLEHIKNKSGVSMNKLGYKELMDIQSFLKDIVEAEKNINRSKFMGINDEEISKALEDFPTIVSSIDVKVKTKKNSVEFDSIMLENINFKDGVHLKVNEDSNLMLKAYSIDKKEVTLPKSKLKVQILTNAAIPNKKEIKYKGFSILLTRIEDSVEFKINDIEVCDVILDDTIFGDFERFINIVDELSNNQIYKDNVIDPLIRLVTLRNNLKESGFLLSDDLSCEIVEFLVRVDSMSLEYDSNYKGLYSYATSEKYCARITNFSELNNTIYLREVPLVLENKKYKGYTLLLWNVNESDSVVLRDVSVNYRKLIELDSEMIVGNYPIDAISNIIYNYIHLYYNEIITLKTLNYLYSIISRINRELSIEFKFNSMLLKQIIGNELEINEIEYYTKILSDDSEIQFKIGANIMLKRFDVAKKQVEELPNQLKKIFEDYPIHRYLQEKLIKNEREKSVEIVKGTY